MKKDDGVLSCTTLVGPLQTELDKPIHSNQQKTCLWCGVTITPENNSGWEAFTEDGIMTQPVCKLCDSEPSGGEKCEVWWQREGEA